MFKKESYKEKGLEIIKVTHQATGSYFSVVQNRAGALHGLAVKKGTLVELFDAGVSLEDHDKWFKGSFLCPFPNRIDAGGYEFEGQRYVLPINFPQENNSIHGFLFDKTFTEVEARGEDVSFELKLEFGYDGSHPGYPFQFGIINTYTFEVNDEVKLTVNTLVKNKSDQKIPFGLGWHPYFKIGDIPVDDLKLQIPSDSIFEVDDRLLPTGNIKEQTDFLKGKKINGFEFDTGFIVNNEPKVLTTLKSEDISLEIEQVVQDQNYKYLQVFIPPSRKSIAIEPMTISANAFNTKNYLETIEEGELKNYQFSIKAY